MPITVTTISNHPSPPKSPPNPGTTTSESSSATLLEDEPAMDTYAAAGAETMTQSHPAPIPEKATSASEVVNLGNVIPSPIYRVSPEYPASALRLGLNGYVDVHFAIHPDGSVANVKIADSSSPRFHSSTLEAIKQWRFKPVVHQGHPVVAYCIKRFSFQQR
jgi:protein TonB